MPGIRGDVFVDDETKKNLLQQAGPIPLSAYIRSVVLDYIADNPLTSTPPPVDDQAITLIPEMRPEALVYTVPINGAKIVVSRNDDGWKGVAYHPEKTGSTFAWNSENFNFPAWAKNSHVTKALLFITSRIDDEGISHFQIPKTGFIISARWDEKKKRFEDGFVTDPPTKRKQKWERGGWFSNMEPGAFNNLPNVRRLQNMICRVLTVADGGLDQKIPL